MLNWRRVFWGFAPGCTAGAALGEGLGGCFIPGAGRWPAAGGDRDWGSSGDGIIWLSWDVIVSLEESTSVSHHPPLPGDLIECPKDEDPSLPTEWAEVLDKFLAWPE